jgi:ABC-type glycerol-3-phosphate transport system substrate-binding protein
MNSLIRKMLAALLIAAALYGCGGSSSGSGAAAGAVDTQLKDDNNWQVIQTADQ